jgi:molybdate transport system regulatory protein
LAEIDRHGSIRVAAQSMTMSYQRAWNLVKEMNALFREPLVVMSRGGETGGGASLTETGREVLERYRRMEEHCREATAEDCGALRRLLRS